ncbi:flavodoxin [Corynebacterium sp.]|uniref:flavodoxin n=1 Tax=Corynebacterium TaxID=1716 RepID=UPI0028AC43F6|nr:flavodoxin [Corynebacterium sp.]
MTQMHRRTLIRGAVALGAGAASAAFLAACGQSRDRGPGQADSPTSLPDSTTDTPRTPGSGPRTALVFFSRPGENYWYGDRRDLGIGNTEVLAGQIADRVDADVIRIDAADPYPHAYDETVDRNRQEQTEDARPEISGETPNLTGYETIILGCPVWNSRAPMIIRTLLDSTDMSGKTIHPFITYAVGEGSVFDDYTRNYPDATIATGFAVKGEEAIDAGTEVDRWVADSGLENTTP